VQRAVVEVVVVLVAQPHTEPVMVQPKRSGRIIPAAEMTARRAAHQVEAAVAVAKTDLLQVGLAAMASARIKRRLTMNLEVVVALAAKPRVAAQRMALVAMARQAPLFLSMSRQRRVAFSR